MATRSLFVLVLICFLISMGTEKKYDKYLIFLCFIAFLFVMTFRGDFTTDAKTYEIYFKQIPNQSYKEIFSLSYHIGYIEIGFALIIKLVSIFTNEYVFALLVYSLFILIPMFFLFAHSDDTWISMLMYLGLSTYFNSFNLIRAFMAVSIFSLSVKFVIKKQFLYYLLIVFFASLIHVSALFLIPVYFIFNIKIKKLNCFLFLILSCFFLVGLNAFIDIYLNIIYKGIFVDEIFGTPIKDICIHIFLYIFIVISIFFNKRLEINREEQVYINGTLIWGCFLISMLRVSLVQRFAYYFEPFLFLSFTHIVNKWYCKEDSKFIISIFVILLTAYYLFWQGKYFDSLFYFRFS